jgi:alkanesulfonate monooxygenase SsuD/methylene tetrahydromethanopterin reductase-like flavin-dependent oxidoreductase (luciferase family)
MRWGVLLPTLDPLRSGGPPRVVEAARLAEGLGFDAVWAGDHLACPAPVLGATQCLAAAAAVTERVTLGVSVLLLGLRPPAWAAKQLVTLDALSGGRLALGVGVGGEFPQEFAAAGVPLRARGARLDAGLAALAGLLARRPHGKIPALEPAISAPPPILVGGRSDAALRRAAHLGDPWLPMWISPATLSRRAQELAELAAAHGRPRPGLALLIGVRVGAAREADAHLRGLYGMGLERVGRWTPVGDADSVGEQLGAYREAGVQELILMPLGPDPLDQLERLADVRDRGGDRVPL